MEIQLTPKSARAMAKRLRSTVPGGLTTGASLEALAVVLGYHNWDTLSGVLSQKASAELEADKAFKLKAERVKYRETPPKGFAPFDLYVEAYACDDWAESPSWLKLHVTEALVTKLHSLQTLVLKQGLDVSQESYEGEWGEADHLSLRNDELHVQSDQFWFTAVPKHGSVEVECRYIAFDELYALIERGEQANISYFAWCDGKLFRDSNSAKSLAESLCEDGTLDLEESRLDEMPA